MSKRVRRAPARASQPVQLGVWSLRVRKRYQVDTPQPVDNFDASGSSLRTFATRWLQELNGAPRSSGRHFFHLGRVAEPGPYDLNGLIEVGSWGERRPIYSILSGERDFTQTIDHASCRPHYFRVHCRPGATVAVIAMEIKPGGSVFGPFIALMIDAFQAAYPDMLLRAKGIAPPKLLEILQNGQLRTIEVDRIFTPQERADRVLFHGAVSKPSKLVIRAESKGEEFLKAPSISAALRSLAEFSRTRTPELLEIPADLGGGMGEVKVAVEYLGKSRTIDLSDTARIRPYVDVTSVVGALDDDGLPDFDRLDAEAAALIQSAASVLSGYQP